MRTINLIQARLIQLRELLQRHEIILESPKQSSKEKKEAGRAAAALAITIEQIEWVLSLRTGTYLDDYTWNEFSSN